MAESNSTKMINENLFFFIFANRIFLLKLNVYDYQYFFGKNIGKSSILVKAKLIWSKHNGFFAKVVNVNIDIAFIQRLNSIPHNPEF